MFPTIGANRPCVHVVHAYLFRLDAQRRMLSWRDATRLLDFFKRTKVDCVAAHSLDHSFDLFLSFRTQYHFLSYHHVPKILEPKHDGKARALSLSFLHGVRVVGCRTVYRVVVCQPGRQSLARRLRSRCLVLCQTSFFIWVLAVLLPCDGNFRLDNLYFP